MNLIKRILSWFDCRQTDFRMEKYLAGSADCAELDYRVRKWEYMSEAERERWW